MSDRPDFSLVDSEAKADEMLQAGALERLLLLPARFGGREVPENIVYVPVGIAFAKTGIDNIIAPLVSEGRVSRYSAVPRYQGNSLVPVAIDVTASAPGHFTSTIKIWGNGLLE